MKINNNNYEFKHNIDTDYGSSGSPIIISGSSLVIGIHKAGDKKEKINYATFIGNIFKINKLNKINNGEEIKDETKNENENKDNKSDEITIIYKNYYNDIKLFGHIFVENNKDKCKIIYKGKEEKLCCYLSEIPSYDRAKAKYNEIIEIKLKK